VRILHIDAGLEIRGGQLQVLILLKALNEQGHQSMLLACENSPLWRKAAGIDIPIHTASLANVCSLSSQVDLVHAHDARGHTLAALASRRPFAVSRRVAFPIRRSIASRWKYGRATRFLAVSQFVAEQLYSAGIATTKVDVVYDSVGEVTATNKWSAKAPAVALASDDPLKGRDFVQLAAARTKIETLFSDDLSCDLQYASMFVYITRSEGLGSAALLAMSMGVPVIASCVGGLKEVFEHDISGLYVKNEPDEIAFAMRRLLSDSDLAANIIRNARARIATRFTTQHMVQGTLQAYSRALAA